MESIVEIAVEFTCRVLPGSFDEDTVEDLKNSIQTQLEIHPQLYDVVIDDLCINETETDEDEDENDDEEEGY